MIAQTDFTSDWSFGDPELLWITFSRKHGGKLGCGAAGSWN
jgi:hypothetical protein